MQPTTQSSNDVRVLMISLGMHSAAIIAFQLSLMQLISIVQWHHFAYMIISIAMLGFGASGTLLSFSRNRILRHANWLIPASMAISGLLMMIVFPISRVSPLQFDVFFLFSGGSGWLKLLVNYLLYFLPFFTGSLAIGIIFVQKSQRIGTYYFSNLLGSALGGILGLCILSRVFPSKAPIFIGLLSWFSGIIILRSKVRWPGIAIGFIGFLIAFMGKAISPGLSEYKALEKALQLPEAEIVISEPSIFGLVEAVHSPAQRYAPAVSLLYDEEIIGGYAIFVNGDFYGPVLPPESRTEKHILDYTTQMLPFITGKKDRVLCINAGTGSSISHALHHGAKQVDAVIENKRVIRLMKEELKEASGGLFQATSLNIYPVQSRSFLARKYNQKYDLIMLPLLEGFGGTSGLNALQEEYSYTLEAFEEMFLNLNPGGMLAISTWQDYPPRTSLKIPVSLAAAARKVGIENPSRHIAAIRSWGTTSFVLKKEAISPDEVHKIREFCQEMLFDPLILPQLVQEERQQFNFLEDQQYFEYLDKIMAGDQKALNDYGFAVMPATDNQPYFSQFLRLKSLKHMSRIFGLGQMPFLELGYLALLVTLFQSILLAAILILLPLFTFKKATKNKTGTLVYFGSLGIGFMFAEIILIQRFVLYLDEPVIAVAAVISTLMLFSGLGSLWSQKFQSSPKRIRTLALLTTFLLLIIGIALTPLLKSTLAFGMPLRIIISLVAIGTPAIFMGMLFPLGIRMLGERDENQIAWAWGINGCLSVISTSLATLIAVEMGFQTVIFLAAFFYLIAGLSLSFPGKLSSKKSAS